MSDSMMTTQVSARIYAGMDFSRQQLRGADYSYADMNSSFCISTDFLDANMFAVNLRKSDLRNARFKRADLRKANLDSANLQKSLLRLARLEGALLRWANLEGANLQDANLEGADLQYARLQGANLKGVNFVVADLREAVYNEKTIWPDDFDPLDHGAIPEDWLPSDLEFEPDDSTD